MRKVRYREDRGVVVFDSEALSLATRGDVPMRARIEVAHKSGRLVVVSAVTLVEVTHPGINQRDLDWVLSRLEVIPVTKALAISAAKLLQAAKLHGHKQAIDAMVCATALEQPGRSIIITSDPDDIRALTDGKCDIIPLT